LSINHTKYEVMGLSPTSRPIWSASVFQIPECSPGMCSLLGSPLDDEGLELSLKAQLSNLRRCTSRLANLSVHEGFFLLHLCLAIPKLMFLMRFSRCFYSKGAAMFDEEPRKSISVGSAYLALSNLARPWLDRLLQVGRSLVF